MEERNEYGGYGPDRYGIGNAAISDKRKFTLLFYGWLGAKAGKNWFDATGNLPTATANGLYSAFRWKVWGGTLCAWTILTLVPAAMFMELGQTRQGYALLTLVWLAVMAVIGLFSLGATYVYAIDLSLFKQGKLYRQLRPVAVRARNVHWAVLHTLVAIPVILWLAVLAFQFYGTGNASV
jgi:hypothetical protein